MRYLDLEDHGETGAYVRGHGWLEPGDVLLYYGEGVWSSLIRLKTWGWASHCELYDREGVSLASRAERGVERYAVRAHNLVAVLRPRWGDAERDEYMLRIRAWFPVFKGQGYDWVGLFAFFIRQRQGTSNRSQFCSELVARLFKKSNYAVVEGDSDAVSPWDFWKSPRLGLFAVSPDLPPRDRV